MVVKYCAYFTWKLVFIPNNKTGYVIVFLDRKLKLSRKNEMQWIIFTTDFCRIIKKNLIHKYTTLRTALYIRFKLCTVINHFENRMWFNGRNNNRGKHKSKGYTNNANYITKFISGVQIYSSIKCKDVCTTIHAPVQICMKSLKIP